MSHPQGRHLQAIPDRMQIKGSASSCNWGVINVPLLVFLCFLVFLSSSRILTFFNARTRVKTTIHQKRPDVHKIVFSIKSRFPQPPPPRRSVNLEDWFEQRFLILGPFQGRGVGVKPNFADRNFIDTQTFLNLPHPPLWGVNRGRFVIFAFRLLYSILGFQDTQKLGKTARKMSLSHPFLCAPSAGKN